MKLYRDTTSCNELSNADAPSSPVLERASFLLCSTYTNLLIVRTESLLRKKFLKHEKISKKESTSFEWESYCWWVAKLYYTFAVVWSSDSHSHVVWWKGVLWHSSLPHYVNSLLIFFINIFSSPKNSIRWNGSNHQK